MQAQEFSHNLDSLEFDHDDLISTILGNRENILVAFFVGKKIYRMEEKQKIFSYARTSTIDKLLDKRSGKNYEGPQHKKMMQIKALKCI